MYRKFLLFAIAIFFFKLTNSSNRFKHWKGLFNGSNIKYDGICQNSSSINGKLKIAVILPRDSRHLFCIMKIAPSIELALDFVDRNDILKKENVELYYRDSNCTANIAMMAGMELYMYRGINVFFGPVFDYALMQISRLSSVWNIPTVTAGGMAWQWNEQRKTPEFSLVTRSSTEISTWSLAGFFFKIFKEMNWEKVALIFDNDADLGILEKFCYMFANSFVKRSKKKARTVLYNEKDPEQMLTLVRNHSSMNFLLTSNF